jgi:kynurenine formamidase
MAVTVASCDRPAVSHGLWAHYDRLFADARYVYLNHVLEPSTPIWYGFEAGRTTFTPAVSGDASVKPVGEAFTYGADGFEATAYTIPTDQFGTQLDPPAHWDPRFPAIDELPASICLRPLVVISIVEKVQRDPGATLTVADVRAWEDAHGRVPAGAVVMVRSDWSKRWTEPDFATLRPFPGVSLDALKFLHLERHILLHGHEPLDTDDTPTLEGEAWLMHHGFLQAEGVTNLDLVPETGALVMSGFPRFAGGTGGLASFVAVCPAGWPHGTTRREAPDAPFPASDRLLRWDTQKGHRVRG